VVLLLLTIVGAGIVPVFYLSGQTWRRVDKHTEMLQNARLAVDKMVREMRAAQSFQTVGGSLIRFTKAAGDAAATTPTIEYQLNAATSGLEYRVAADFAYRRRLTITSASAVPAGYSVALVFNHAALVTAGKSLAGGDDVRIRYWSGTRWIELDRVKDVTTNWNTAATRVWFQLQTAIAAGGSNNNYYLHYGDLSSGAPPANGDYVFLDYEDGTTLANWTRRDACNGTYTATADGFWFQTTTSSCTREVSKPVANGNVEIFWGFRSNAPGPNTNRHQVGMSARRSDTGAGYMALPGQNTANRLRIRRVASWSSTGASLDNAAVPVVPGVDYYARFYLVGAIIQAKQWQVGTAEPAWQVNDTDATYVSGLHYGLVDAQAAPEDQRHRCVTVRLRVADPEPVVALAAEENGARTDAFEPLAGPFRAMAVQCYDAAGTAIACASSAAVKSIQVALTAMDPTGEVTDVVVTTRAFRQAP
jgi:hypothetical protein